LRGIGYAGYVSGEVYPLPDSDTASQQTIASFNRWFHGNGDSKLTRNP
jgi:hypothetical protein